MAGDTGGQVVTVTANKVVLVVVGVCVEDLEGHDDDEIQEVAEKAEHFRVLLVLILSIKHIVTQRKSFRCSATCIVAINLLIVHSQCSHSVVQKKSIPIHHLPLPVGERSFHFGTERFQ